MVITAARPVQTVMYHSSRCFDGPWMEVEAGVCGAGSQPSLIVGPGLY